MPQINEELNMWHEEHANLTSQLLNIGNRYYLF